jgi:hypothetical protein
MTYYLAALRRGKECRLLDFLAFSASKRKRRPRRDLKIDDSPLVAVAGALYRWGLQEAPLPAVY